LAKTKTSARPCYPELLPWPKIDFGHPSFPFGLDPTST
jgi:hypothetical protein